MDTKTCSTCGSTKPVSDFRKDRNQCLTCLRAVKLAYYHKTKPEGTQPQKNPHYLYGQPRFITVDGEEQRLCCNCIKYKPFTEYYKSTKGVKGIAPNCIDCSREIKRERRLADPEKDRQIKRAWEKANPDKHKAADKLRGERYRQTEKFKTTRAKYTEEHKEEILQRGRIDSKNKVNNLSLAYVKQCMRGRLKKKDALEIPDELAEVYREIMRINREVKERENEKRS